VGWKAVTNVQAGGGLYAQHIVPRRYYDLKCAKEKALRGRYQGQGFERLDSEHGPPKGGLCISPFPKENSGAGGPARGRCAIPIAHPLHL